MNLSKDKDPVETLGTLDCLVIDIKKREDPQFIRQMAYFMKNKKIGIHVVLISSCCEEEVREVIEKIDEARRELFGHNGGSEPLLGDDFDDKKTIVCGKDLTKKMRELEIKRKKLMK